MEKLRYPNQKIIRITPEIQDLLPHKQIQCPEMNCMQIFSNIGNLQLHLTRHHKKNKLEKSIIDIPNTIKLYYCPSNDCIYNELIEHGGRYFTNMKYIRQHYQKVHMMKTFQCQKCTKLFGTSGQHKAHELNCGKIYQCGTCECNYSTNEALLTHIKRKKHTITNPISHNNDTDNNQLYKIKLPPFQKTKWHHSKIPKTKPTIKMEELKSNMNHLDNLHQEEINNNVQEYTTNKCLCHIDRVYVSERPCNPVEFQAKDRYLETRPTDSATKTTVVTSHVDRFHEPERVRKPTHVEGARTEDRLFENRPVTATTTTNTKCNNTSTNLYQLPNNLQNVYLIQIPPPFKVKDQECQTESITNSNNNDILITNQLENKNFTEIDRNYSDAMTETNHDNKFEIYQSELKKNHKLNEQQYQQHHHDQQQQHQYEENNDLCNYYENSCFDELVSSTNFCDIETQTEYPSVLDELLYSTTQTQTCKDFLNEFHFTNIQTQTNWSSISEDDLNGGNCDDDNVNGRGGGAHDEFLVSTETQTSFTQCLLECNNQQHILSNNSYGGSSRYGGIAQQTQTCDTLLDGLFGGHDFINNFQSTYTQT